MAGDSALMMKVASNGDFQTRVRWIAKKAAMAIISAGNLQDPTFQGQAVICLKVMNEEYPTRIMSELIVTDDAVILADGVEDGSDIDDATLLTAAGNMLTTVLKAIGASGLKP